MVTCLFGQRYLPGADLVEEARIGAELLRELEQLDGFVSYHSYTSEDGEVLGVIRFDSRDALERWRDHPAHRATWSRAKEFYAEFWIQDSETYREYRWSDGLRHNEELRERFRSTGAHGVAYRPSAAA
jgi:heme-degrading monooxygenase HmoA